MVKPYGRVFATLFLVVSGAAAAATPDERFERLAERFLDRVPALSPVTATELGDHRFDGELDEVSAARKPKVRWLPPE